jgi:hypothetical protein
MSLKNASEQDHMWLQNGLQNATNCCIDTPLGKPDTAAILARYLAVYPDLASCIVVTGLVPKPPVVHHTTDALILHTGTARFAGVAAGRRQRRAAALTVTTLKVPIPNHLLASLVVDPL